MDGKGAVRAKLIAEREATIDDLLPGPPALPEDEAELRTENGFLRDQVRRLTDELARAQSALGHSHSTADGASQGGRSFLEALPDGAPLPAWLSDSQYLSPLLLAYDQRIAEQEARLAAQLDGLTTMSARVETVVRENETLAGDLDHHMALLASKADTLTGGSVPEEHQELLDRIDLLTKENDLLMVHQHEQSKALLQAKREVEERTEEVMSFQRELALSATREATASKEMHELDAICHELQEEVRLLAAKCVESENAVTSITAELKEKTEAHATGLSALHFLQSEHHTLQQEYTGTSEREAAMNTMNLALQRDLDETKQQLSSTLGELNAEKGEASKLQDALVSVEARMTEYTQKELRVFESLKAAKAAAEDAISVRDRVLQRADALEGEVLELRSQLKSEKLQHAKTLSEQLDALSDRSKGEIAGLRAAVRAHELAKVEAEARQAKAERELGTAEARIHVLERAVATSHADGGNPDLDMRLVEAERSRDVAEQRAAANQRATQLAAQEWERQRLHLVATAAEAEQELQRVSGGVKALQTEVLDLRARCETAERSERALQRQKKSAEAAWAKAGEDESTAYAAQVAALSKRLETALAAREELRAQMQSRLDQQEGRVTAANDAAHAAEVALQQAQDRSEALLAKAEARATASELQLASLSDAATEIKRLRAAEAELKPRCATAEKQVKQLLAQVRELEASESDLMMARKELHSAVDRLADDKARAERLARMALKKGDALKRQVEMFASLPPSKPLLPLGGVKSAKADKADKLKRPGRERERDGVENRAPRR